MTDEQLRGIRNRDEAGAGILDGTNRLIDGGLQCFKDRRWLLSEVERLRAALSRTPAHETSEESCLHCGKIFKSVPRQFCSERCIAQSIEGKAANLLRPMAENHLRTPQGEPALTSPWELPGTRVPVVIAPKGNAGESPALSNEQYTVMAEEIAKAPSLPFAENGPADSGKP